MEIGIQTKNCSQQFEKKKIEEKNDFFLNRRKFKDFRGREREREKVERDRVKEREREKNGEKSINSTNSCL